MLWGGQKIAPTPLNKYTHNTHLLTQWGREIYRERWEGGGRVHRNHITLISVENGCQKTDHTDIYMNIFFDPALNTKDIDIVKKYIWLLLHYPGGSLIIIIKPHTKILSSLMQKVCLRLLTNNEKFTVHKKIKPWLMHDEWSH